MNIFNIKSEKNIKGYTLSKTELRHSINGSIIGVLNEFTYITGKLLNNWIRLDSDEFLKNMEIIDGELVEGYTTITTDVFVNGEKTTTLTQGSFVRGVKLGSKIYMTNNKVIENVGLSKNQNFIKNKVKGFMATSHKNTIILTWEASKFAYGYNIYEVMDNGRSKYAGFTKRTSHKFYNKEFNQNYRYYIEAVQVNNNVKSVSERSDIRVASTTTTTTTIKNLLNIAITPIGQTLFVNGGGWNPEYTGPGIETRKLGVSEDWSKFYLSQNKDYNPWKFNFSSHRGLDSASYIAFVMYNALEKINGLDGYLVNNNELGSYYASLGIGEYTISRNFDSYESGDIMFNEEHAYIVLGEMPDSSIVILHCNSDGPKISGTATKQGNKNSQALQLADYYMSKYFGDFYKKYEKLSVPTTYFKQFNKIKLNRNIFSDPDGYRKMTAEEILSDLFMYR